MGIISREKATYGRFSQCGCNTRALNSPCHCNLCAEKDSNGQIIQRTSCTSAASTALPLGRASGDYTYLQASHNTPCTLQVKIENVQNYPMASSIVTDCPSINGTYLATNNGTCRWDMHFCNQDRLDNPRFLANGGLFLAYDPNDGWAVSQTGWRNVHLFCYVNQGSPCSTAQQRTVYTSTPVGQAFVRTTQQNFSYPTYVPTVTLDCNSTVDCTNFVNVVMSGKKSGYDALSPATIVNSPSCNGYDVLITVNSVDDYSSKYGSAEKISSAGYYPSYTTSCYSGTCEQTNSFAYFKDVTSLNNVPTNNKYGNNTPFTFSNFTYPFIFDSIAFTGQLAYGRPYQAYVVPSAVVLTIAGVTTSPDSPQYSGCQSCESMNGQHLLSEFTFGGSIVSYKKTMDYYDRYPTSYSGFNETVYKPLCCTPADQNCTGTELGYCLKSITLDLPSGTPSSITFTNPASSPTTIAKFNRPFSGKLTGNDFLLDNYVYDTGVSLFRNANQCVWSGATLSVEPYYPADTKTQQMGCLDKATPCVRHYGYEPPEELLVTIPDNWYPIPYPASFDQTGLSGLRTGCGVSGYWNDSSVMPNGDYVFRRVADTSFCPDTTQVWQHGCSYYYENPDKGLICGRANVPNVNPYQYDDASPIYNYSPSGEEGVNVCNWDYMTLELDISYPGGTQSENTNCNSSFAQARYKLDIIGNKSANHTPDGETCTRTNPIEEPIAIYDCVSGYWNRCYRLCGTDSCSVVDPTESFRFGNYYQLYRFIGYDDTIKMPTGGSTKFNFVDMSTLDKELYFLNSTQSFRPRWKWGNDYFQYLSPQCSGPNLCYDSSGLFVASTSCTITYNSGSFSDKIRIQAL